MDENILGNLEVIPHSSYSPDISSFDYHFVCLMAYNLAEQHFHSYKDTKKKMDRLVVSLKDNFFSDVVFKCIQKNRKK